MVTESSGWREIEIGLSELAQRYGNVRMFMKEFDTSEDPEGWRSFLYKPLNGLREAGIVEGDGWRVATLIINHHKPLNPRIGLVSATLDDDEQEAGITIYKLEE
jgi:hypothetical protein